jgi:Cu/Zn superoxide dismutase
MFHGRVRECNTGCDNPVLDPFPGLTMRALALVVPIVVLSACTMTSRLPNDPRQLPEVVVPKAAPSAVTAFIAQLRPVGGSAAQGAVTIADRGGTMVAELTFGNVASGTYAWMLHANGNCSSPNGFSAGAGWVPKGVRKAAADLLPEFVVNSERDTTVTARVRDANVLGDGGVVGRSVLIYQGGGIQPIKPGVPNNVVACGVFEPARSRF